MAIDVGPGAWNDAAAYSSRTAVDETNPANADGTIDHVETFFSGTGTNFESASFIHEGGTDFSTNGVSGALGNLADGFNEWDAPGDFTAFNISTGEYIGAYWASGTIERRAQGNMWFNVADNIPASSVTFSNYVTTREVALYATGVESGGTDVDCTLGQINIAGLNSDIAVATDINCTLGQINIAGLNATIETGTIVDCTLGQININGLNANITSGTNIDCTLGQINIAGLNAEILTAIDVNCTLGQINVNGLNASILVDTDINCILGQINITGLNANLFIETDINVTLGQVNVSGLNSEILVDTNIDCTLGQINIAGLNAQIIAATNINCTLGQVNINGLNAIISLGGIITPLDRTYPIEQENRIYAIDFENRIYPIT